MSIIVVRATHRSAFEQGSSIDEGERDLLVEERLLAAAMRGDIVLAYEGGPYYDRQVIEDALNQASEGAGPRLSFGLENPYVIGYASALIGYSMHLNKVPTEAALMYARQNMFVNLVNNGAFRKILKTSLPAGRIYSPRSHWKRSLRSQKRPRKPR